jgi:large conductance mechanosensitive channel
MARAQAIVREFREFINQGNVFEVAVGLIMALAFAPVVESLVNDVIMQIIAAIVGEPDFRTLTINLPGEGVIRYGAFINAVISFLLMATVVFMLVKLYNQTMRRARGETEKAAGEEPAGPTEIELLTEIRDSLRR